MEWVGNEHQSNAVKHNSRTNIIIRDRNQFEPSPDAIDLADLLTIEDAADRLDIPPWQVKSISTLLGVGRTVHISNYVVRYFSRADVEQIREALP